MKRNKRAIVCGSTDGIGKAVAINLCKENYSITLIARNLSRLQKVKSELESINQNHHALIQLDLDHPEKIKEILSSNIDFSDNEDLILINNVGGPLPKDILECSIEEFQPVFNKYLLSFHELTKFFAPKMKKNKWGRIVNILGTTTLEPIPGLGLSVIKGATSNWSKALSIELGRYNITVNNILPGPTNTKELKSIVKILAAKAKKTEKEYLKEAIESLPLRRIAEPHEIAYAVSFLCSENASYITGSNLKIDGGFTTCL